jgi:hypothetical protein
MTPDACSLGCCMRLGWHGVKACRCQDLKALVSMSVLIKVGQAGAALQRWQGRTGGDARPDLGHGLCFAICMSVVVGFEGWWSPWWLVCWLSNPTPPWWRRSFGRLAIRSGSPPGGEAT